MIAYLTHFSGRLRNLAFSVLLISAVIASTSLVSAAELHISRAQLPISLGLYLEHMEDPSGELGLDDVLQLKSQWQRSTQDVPTLGFSTSAHWFTVAITGNALNESSLAVSIKAPTVDRIEFFVLHNNEVVSSYLSGDTIPLSQQSVRNRIPIFPITTAEDTNEIEIYFRVSSQSGIELPISLTTLQQIAEEQQSQIAFFGGFFILFLVCFAVCWIIFYFQRDRQFLGYTIFFGSCLIFFLTITGMGKVWFWSESVELSNRLSYTSGSMLIVSFCLLGQSLSLTGKLRHRVVIVLRFIAYAMIPTCLYFLFVPLEYISGSNIQLILALGLVVSIVVFAMASVAAAQGSRVAFYLVITWGQLILAYLSLLAYKFNLVEKNDLSVLVSEALVAFSGITLLLSLAEFVKSKNEAFTQVNLEARAKSDFLSNVSKEFLTPVHLILANSKRLMAVNANKLDQPTYQHMTTVIKQSEHLHNLINDLLEMAEIDSDSFEPQFELVEITQLLSDIKDIMTPAIME